MLDRIARLLNDWRTLCFVLTVLVAGALSPGVLPAFTPNNSLELWFVQSDPNLVAFRESQRMFANDETVIVYFEPRAGLLDPGTLTFIDTLTRRCEKLPFIDEVVSLTTIKDIVLKKVKDEEGGDEEMLASPRLVPLKRRVVGKKTIVDARLSAAQRKAIRHKLSHDPLYRGWLTNKALTGTVISLRFKAIKDLDHKRDAFNAQIRTLLHETFFYDGPLHGVGHRYHMSGTGLVYTELNRYSNHDAAIFSSLGYLLIFAMLTVILRSGWGLFVSGMVIVLTTLITMGLFGLMGHQINNLSIILPTLLVIVSIADSVHVIQHHRKLLPPGSQDKAQHLAASQKTIRAMLLPCLLTSVTTFFGFISLQFTDIQLLREFGVYCAIGVLVAYWVTFVVCAFFLPRLPFKALAPRAALADRVIARVIRGCQYLVGQHPRKVIGGFVVVSALLVVGMTRLVPDLYTLGFFPDDAQIVVDSKAIEAQYGYYLPLEFNLLTRKPAGVLEPDFLRKLARWQRESRKVMVDVGGGKRVPAVTDSTSFADVMLKIHQVNTGEKDFPKSSLAIKQELELFGDRKLIDPVISFERDRARVIFKTRMFRGSQVEAAYTKLQKLAKSIFDKEVEVRPVGFWPLYVAMANYLLSSQLNGFSLAFFSIFALIFIMFRNIRLSLFAIFPNIFPVLVALGLMGFQGVLLDLATISIASIVICIAVDDTIHLTYQLKETQQLFPDDPLKAVTTALDRVGPALIGTTLILVIGFGIFFMASIKTILYFGTYLSISMLGALLADLLLFPALVVAFPSRACKMRMRAASAERGA